MGIRMFSSSCYTNRTSVAVAPNPSPSRWRLLEKREFEKSYVLKVQYLDCTNFEGVKVMVFKGIYKHQSHLDPHFSPDKSSPIARFRPTKEGWEMAVALAKSISER